MNKRPLIIGLITVGSLPALGFLLLFTLQYGYCHGWWGKENLAFRSWWLCSCPVGFEQSLYPENIEVMFSACQNAVVTDAANGRYLYVVGDVSYPLSDRYLLDITTGERTPINLTSNFRSFDFLTRDLIVVHHSRGNRHSTITNWQDERSVPIDFLDAEMLPSPFRANGSIDPDMLALFEDAGHVYFFDSFSFAVVLAEDWSNNPDRNFLIGERQLPNVQRGWLKTVIEAARIPYDQIERITSDSSIELLSHDGQLVARQDGVYEVATEKLLLPIALSERIANFCPGGLDGLCYPGYFPFSWWPDDSAVLYRFNSTVPTTINLNLAPHLTTGAPKEFERLSLPVLRIEVPEAKRDQAP